jgi:hypothetical protein
VAGSDLDEDYMHVELHLTSGEARVMAAQLTSLADALDMPRYKRRKR